MFPTASPSRRHRTCLRLESLEVRLPPAIVTEPLADINRDTISSIESGGLAEEWVAWGESVYFPATADYGLYGYHLELWASDGTEAGTRQVTDIVPGVVGSEPRFLTVAGDKIFFIAHDLNGWDLWVFDPVAETTLKLTNFRAGPDSRRLTGAPNDLTAVGDRLFFSGFGSGGYGSGGWEPWTSDGTVAGTHRVKDVRPGGNGSLSVSQPNNFAAVGDLLYFTADDGTHGRELWRSDGTEAGTLLVKDIRPGSASGDPFSMIPITGGVLFEAGFDGVGDELWFSDGTADGTRLVKDIRPGVFSSAIRHLTVAGGIGYFSASDGTHAEEVWRSDGTEAGTFMVHDFASTFAPEHLTAVGDELYFVKILDIWKTDGTTQGTLQVTDHVSGVSPTDLDNLLDVGGTLYFTGETAGHGNELWRSDGTPAGTVRVEDLYPGKTGSSPRHLVAASAGDRVFFAAYDDEALLEPWVSDGTAAGTRMIADINQFTDSSNVSAHFFTEMDGITFFYAHDGVHGFELWRTDGTSGGTAMVMDIRPGEDSALDPYFGFPAVMDGFLYFAADDGVNGVELWRTDGTDAGTTMVSDVGTTIFAGTRPREITVVGDTLFFGNRADGELWKSDGTEAGTVRVKDIFVGNNGSNPQDFTEAGGLLYFRAQTALGYELWRTDGTEEGTIPLGDIRPGAAGSAPDDLTAFDGRLFFTAIDGILDDEHGRELWVTDGTLSGTVMFLDVNPGSDFGFYDDGVNRFTVAGGQMFFAANDGVHGQELWKTDGSLAGTAMVKDINPYPGLGSINDISVLGMMVAVGDEVFFAADDDVRGHELWKSDGTLEGTVLVKDIFPGPRPYNSSYPWVMTPFGGQVFFAADDYFHGRELWRTDGTPEGTRLVLDIDTLPGLAGDPIFPTAIGDILYFSAFPWETGIEPWTLRFVLLAATLGPVSPDPRNVVVASLPISFNAPTDGFDLSDLSLTRDGVEVPLGGATLTMIDTAHWTLGNMTALTAAEGDYRLTLTADGSGIVEIEGGPLAADAFAEWTMDLTAPNVLDIAPVSPNPRNVPLDAVVVTFTEAIDAASAGLADLTLTRDGSPVSLSGEVAVLRVAPMTYRIEGLAVFTGSDGDYSLVLAGSGITDLAGNAGIGTAAVGWTMDATAPVAPVIAGISEDTGLPDDGVTGDATLTITGQAEANAVVALWVDGEPMGTTAADGSGEWQVDASGVALEEGAHVIQATATDAAGNAGPSGEMQIVIDTVAPAVPAVTGYSDDTGVAGDSVTSDADPTLSGTAEDGAEVVVFLDGTPIGTTSAGGGSWSFAIPALPDGHHVLTATATDLAGNVSAATPAFSITVDSVAPDAPVGLYFSPDSGIVGDGVTRVGDLLILGSAEPFSTFLVWEAGAPLGTGIVDAQGTWSVSVSLGEGTHHLTADATDAAGNVSLASVPLSITVDATPPAAPAIAGLTIDSGIPGDALTNDRTPTLTGTAMPGDVVRLYAGATLLAEVTSDGEWSLTSPQLAEGLTTLRVTAVDAAGNESAHATFTVDIDVTAPVGVVSPLPADSTVSAFLVSWTGTDGPRPFAGTFDVYVSDDGSPWALWQDDTAATSAEHPAVAGHRYRFHAVATDNAGNSEDPSPLVEAQTRASREGEVYPADAGRVRKVKAKRGLLADDIREPGSTYLVEVVDAPAHGELTLQANGAFKYVADAAFPGLDVFTYRVVKNPGANQEIGEVTRVTMSRQIVQFKKTLLKAREGTKTYAIAVKLRKPAAPGDSVGYAVVPGTATSADHFLDSGTLTFVPGKRKQVITFTVATDGISEGTETFVVDLIAPTAGAVGTKGTLTVSLLDADDR